MLGLTLPQPLYEWFSKSGFQAAKKLSRNADSQAKPRATESRWFNCSLGGDLASEFYYISQMILNSAKVEDHCLRTVVLPIEHASAYYLECWFKHRPLPPTPRVSDFICLVWVCVSRWWSQGTPISPFGMDLFFLLATVVFSCIFTIQYPAESSEQILGVSPSFLAVQPSPFSLSSHFCLPRLSALSPLRESTGFCLHPLPVLPRGKHLQTVCWGNPRAAFVCCLISQGSLFHCLMLNVFKTIVLSFIYFK